MEKRAIQDRSQCAGAGLACAVGGHADWDLNLPVGVIDARYGKRGSRAAVGDQLGVKASAVIRRR